MKKLFLLLTVIGLLFGSYVYSTSGSVHSLIYNKSTGDVTGVIRGDDSITFSGHKNKYQEKFLLQDFVSSSYADITTGNSTFRFDNLTVGKLYKVTLHYLTSSSNTVKDGVAYIYHDDAQIGRAFVDYTGNVSDATTRSANFVVTATFIATGTDVRFSLGGSNSSVTSFGNGTKIETWASLEELNNYEQTNEW